VGSGYRVSEGKLSAIYLGHTYLFASLSPGMCNLSLLTSPNR